MLDRYRALRLEPPVEDTPETGRSRR
jgi:hypothetical protein